MPSENALDRQSLVELLPLYALGGLSEEEQAAVEDLLEREPALRSELRAYRTTVGRLPESLSPVSPPARVRERLLERIEADRQQHQGASVTDSGRSTRSAAAGSPATRNRPEPGDPPRWRRWLGSGGQAPMRLAAGLALVALLAWGIASRAELERRQARIDALEAQVTEMDRLRGQIEELEDLRDQVDALDGLQDRITELEDQLAAEQRFSAIAEAPGARFIRIEGTEAVAPGSPARGQLVVDPANRRGALLVSDLPALEERQDYQLWLIGDAGPVSAGVFEVDDRGRAVLGFEATGPAGFDAIGVSIEPRGGSSAPTGDIVLYGEGA